MNPKRDSLHARRLELFRSGKYDLDECAIIAASEYRQQHPAEQDPPNPLGYVWNSPKGRLVGVDRGRHG